jgi:hypothetical protein
VAGQRVNGHVTQDAQKELPLCGFVLAVYYTETLKTGHLPGLKLVHDIRTVPQMDLTSLYLDTNTFIH